MILDVSAGHRIAHANALVQHGIAESTPTCALSLCELTVPPTEMLLFDTSCVAPSQLSGVHITTASIDTPPPIFGTCIQPLSTLLLLLVIYVCFLSSTSTALHLTRHLLSRFNHLDGAK